MNQRDIMNQKNIQILFDVIKNPKLETTERNRQTWEIIVTMVANKTNWGKFDSTFDITDENGATLLLFTLFKGHVDIFRMLLEAGANPNTSHKITGVTPLTYAAEEGHIDIVRWLLKAKANPDLPNLITKIRPIDLAVKEGHLKITQWLVEAGVSPKLPNPETGITPLASAAEQGHTDIAQWLIGIIQELDSHNFKTGETPLSLAIKKGHLNIARLLLEAYVDPNLPNPIFGERLLPWAAEKGDINTVQLLLKYRADYDLPNVNTGDTALICAAGEGHLEVVKILVDACATLELRNKKFNTGLDEAIENQKLDIVALLLSRGSLIKFQTSLFDFLATCDQSDPDVLSSLTELCEQLSNTINNPYCVGTEYLKEEFKKADTYLNKLKALTAIHQGKLFNTVNEAIGGTMLKDIVSIVVEYSAPLENPRLKFFKPAEIDTLLPKQEEKKQDSCVVAEPEVNLHHRRSICRFM